MRTYKSILAATAAAAFTFCAAGTTSAATTITIANFNSVGAGIYTFGAALSPGDNANTYVVGLSITQAFDALFAMQNQNGGPDPIQFELEKYNGSTWTKVAQSNYTPGSVIPASAGPILLQAGSYELMTDQVGVPLNAHGSLDGSITLTSVPEPAAWAMLILGLGLVGFATRRRREGMAAAAA